jgi:hypothetical protein
MQQLHTPRLSTALGGLNRRSLNKEFENKYEAEPKFSINDTNIPKVPEPTAEKNNHYVGDRTGVTSRIETSQLLFSSPQTPFNRN